MKETIMRELPILFSSPMIVKILTCAKCSKISLTVPCSHCGSTEFCKTQTRRVAKPQPPKDAALVELHDADYLVEELRGKVSWFVPSAHDLWPCNREDAIKPRYQVGDQLFVREAFYESPMTGEIAYKADGFVKGWRPRPSIHLPKIHSRLWLEVTAVKVERVQDISEEDAKAEGVTIPTSLKILTDYYGKGSECRTMFEKLWDSINGKTYPWASNPWVFAYTFKRINQS